MTGVSLPEYETVEVLVRSIALDTFSRTVSNGWGTSDLGGGWAVFDGPASDISVNGSVGIHSHPTIANRSVIIDQHTPDQDVTIYFRMPVAPTGGSAAAIVDLRCRWIDNSNHYAARVGTDGSGLMTFTATRRSAALGNQAYTPGVTAPLDTSHWYGMRIFIDGSDFRAKFWDDTARRGLQPDWQVAVIDTAQETGNLVCVLSIPVSVTNTLPFEFWFENVTLAVDHWVDISDRVRTNVAALEAPAGRQTALEEIQNTRFVAALDNRDRRFTPGNPASDLWPFWDQGCPIRWRTTIAGGTVGQFRGVVEMPQDFVNFAEVDDNGAAHMYCAVTAVDRLTQLDRAPAFISTLAAHNISVAGESLRAYYTFDDSGLDFRDAAGKLGPMAPKVLSGGQESGVIDYRAGPSLPGDDLSPVHFTLLPAAPPFVAGRGSRPPTVEIGTPLVLAGTDVLTLTMWVRRSIDYALVQPLQMVYLEASDNGKITGTLTDVVGIYGTVPPGFSLGVALNNLTAVTDPVGTLRDGSTDRWFPIGLQVSLSPASASLWVNDETATSALAGSMPASVPFILLFAAHCWDGNIAHLMIHIGPAGTYTHADFLAQREVGLSGLEGQKVDERLRTIANYAGVDDAELNLQRSSTVMPRASLAGQRPGAAMRAAAAAADTGPLFTNGDGELVFQSRRHRYNV